MKLIRTFAELGRAMGIAETNPREQVRHCVGAPFCPDKDALECDMCMWLDKPKRSDDGKDHP